MLLQAGFFQGASAPKPQSHDILVHCQLVTFGEKTNNGILVSSVADFWREVYRQIKADPAFLFKFAQHPRKFEEFIASTYDLRGFNTELTPRSGDGGRDVIATLPGFGSVRFLEQAKAFSPNNLVTHNDVRAMIGVSLTDQNTSKVMITTTSDFAPGVTESNEFRHLMPHRLELKSGTDIPLWLSETASKKGFND